jgi:hypothetical protein
MGDRRRVSRCYEMLRKALPMDLLKIQALPKTAKDASGWRRRRRRERVAQRTDVSRCNQSILDIGEMVQAVCQPGAQATGCAA